MRYFRFGSQCLFALVSVSVLFSPDVCLDSYFYVARWPLFGKELLIRFTVSSLCIFTIRGFSYFPLWFRGREFGSDLYQFLIIAYLLRFIPLAIPKSGNC